MTNEKKTKEEISEENKCLEEELNVLVEKLSSDDPISQHKTLEELRDIIRSSTTSMTSVPLPLKYLGPHYSTLKEFYKQIKNDKTRRLCADIISVLAIGLTDRKEIEGKRECLKYCSLAKKRDIGDWGHEYVRHLEAEIAEEWMTTPVDSYESARSDLLPIVSAVIKFDMQHNAEIQACDLLMEISCLELLPPLIDNTNFLRICNYLHSCAVYVDQLERKNILNMVMLIFLKFQEYPRALCLALHMNDTEKMLEIFQKCKDVTMKKQLAYIAARQLVVLDLKEGMETDSDTDVEELIDVMSNVQVNDNFLKLGKELDVLEPKLPEDVYKTWLENIVSRSFTTEAHLDSARQNLASSLVNGFVNAGFCRDKLITVDDGKNWIYRNKERGMITATASLGLIHLWDVDGGLSPIDRYLYSTDDFIKAGALMAIGIVNCGVRNECDPAKALLTDYVMSEKSLLRIGSILGLGLAYAGSNRDDIIELFLPVLRDDSSNSEVVALAALACGLIAVGTANQTVISAIENVLLDPEKIHSSSSFTRFLPLALGLCFLGCKEMIGTMLPMNSLKEPFKSLVHTMLQMCAYAGTSDVLIVQQMLHICSENHVPDENNPNSDADDHSGKTALENALREDTLSIQGVATLGVAAVAIGEEVGSEMTKRIFGQLGRYGEPSIRRAVPLAIALTSVSNPEMSIIDILNKYSHDSDIEVAQNAIFCMGLVGAGTNNARLATMLRQLAQYHAKNASILFLVRIAQGLSHMGKGTISLAPFHSNRQILSPVALAGLLVILVSCLDIRSFLLGKSHYLLYCLALSMHPRWLVTVDENLKPINISVRVGQAVDVVGKAGTPKTISGARTQTTPVLLGVGERAELVSDKYIALTPILEGFVILRNNPDFLMDYS